MKRRTRMMISSLAALVAAGALFHMVENGRASRAWTAWQRECEAQGEPLDPAAYAPKVIPDADNFASEPLIAAAIAGRKALADLPKNWPDRPVGDWRLGRRADLEAYHTTFPDGNLDKGLEPYRTTLDEIAQAASRPGCRVEVNYSAPDPIPSLLGFRAAGRLLQLRALSALRSGHPDAALEDAITLLRVVNQFQREPFLLCQLLRMAMGGIAMQPLWEGLETHAWSDAQLARLQGELTGMDFLSSMALGWKHEQAFLGSYHTRTAAVPAWSWARPAPPWGMESKIGLRERLRRIIVPRGWELQNAVRAQNYLREILSAPLDPIRHRLDPRRADAALAAIARPRHTPYTFMLSTAAPALAEQNVRVGRIQTGFDQALIACALERQRLAKGAYPDTLADLHGPIPADVITGQPLHYLRTAEGGYLLYSVGWNGVDDGGQPGQGKEPLREGDWVWMIHGR